MRSCLVALLLAVAGCTHAIILYPRGGGEQATGTVNDASKNMEVRLRGDTYTGSYVLGQTVSVGMVGGANPVPVTTVGSTNNATALLTGPEGVLRCEFRIVAARGGNGVCVDSSNTIYDMLIK